MTFSQNKIISSESENVLMDLANLGLLRISGEGAAKLLQGQLTCNLDEISPTQTRLGAYCTPQGRMLSLFRLFIYQGDYYLQMPAEILPETQKTLQKYAVFFKVKLDDASSEYSRISCSGPDIEAALKEIFPELPQNIDEALPQEQLLIIKLPGIFPHYEFIGATADLWEKISRSAETAGINSWNYSNIAAGIPSIYSETIGKLLPHEVNLPQVNGVSFTKGCYTGQEIIARMQYRGQLKKHMYRARVKTSTLPLPGQDIFHDQSCGTIVASCMENESTSQILFIAAENDIETRQLFLDSAKIEPLELLPLPY